MYLEIKDVKKSYGSDASYIQVLKGITTSLEKGQMCVIQGTSGSGKSTLLNCIGGLDTMDSGSVKVDGKEIFGLKPDKLADYRKENLGFIFQFYNLVPNLTVVKIFRFVNIFQIRHWIWKNFSQHWDFPNTETSFRHSFQAVSSRDVL